MPVDVAPVPSLLSVIVPLREPDEAVLARCLVSFDSLPSAARLEVVLVHTGPFDITLCDVARRIGHCVRVECAEPGIYAAFNRGIEHATGRFLLFYGHDDIALPDMEQALQLLASEGDDAVLLACAVYVQGLGVRRPSRLRQAIVLRNWGHQGLFYASALFRGRRYDLRYPLRADHRLNIALLADRGVRCVRSPRVVTYFARGGFSTSNIADLHFDAEQARIAGEEFGWLWGMAVRVLLPVVRRCRLLLRRASTYVPWRAAGA